MVLPPQGEEIPKRSEQVNHELRLDLRAYRRGSAVERYAGWIKENGLALTRFDTFARSILSFLRLAVLER